MKFSKLQFLFLIVFMLTSCDQPQQPTTTAVSPTPTPVPVKPFLDFDHPRLHEIAGDKPLIIDELVRTTNQDPAFVAVIVETSDPILNQEMLLFRVKDNRSTLIYDLAPQVYMTFNIENENHPGWLLDGIVPLSGFLGVLPVLISGGGNCYDCGHIVLISIPQSGEAQDITPVTGFVPKGFVYLTGSGRAGRIELVGTRYYEWDYGSKSHVGSPFAFHLYAWDGNSYMDVSKNEKDFFDEKTSELVIYIKSTYEKPFVSDPIMPLLSEIFFNYESSGRTEYGWEQIKSLGDLSHWDIKNTSPEEIQIYHEVFTQLEQRKNEDIATSTVTPSP